MRPQIPIAVEDAPLITNGASSGVMNALKEYASNEDIDARALLEELRDLSDPPTFGGPDCLTPLEVATMCTTRDLAPERTGHLSHCEDCQALVATSLPTPALVEEFLGELATSTRT